MYILKLLKLLPLTDERLLPPFYRQLVDLIEITCLARIDDRINVTYHVVARALHMKKVTVLLVINQNNLFSMFSHTRICASYSHSDMYS